MAEQQIQHAQVVLGGDGLPPLPDDPEPLPEPMVTPSQPAQRQQYAPGQLPQRALDGIPKFFIKPVLLKNGEYENREYVQILITGDNKCSPVHKVTDGYREKYRPWYDLWRRNLEDTPAGTPLEMWPIITPAEVMVLKSNNIFTVEQLVDMADANDHNIPMAKTLKRKARDWLAVKESAVAIEQSAAEREALKNGMSQLESANEALAAQNAQLADQMATLLKRFGDDEGGADPAPAVATKAAGKK